MAGGASVSDGAALGGPKVGPRTSPPPQPPPILPSLSPGSCLGVPHPSCQSHVPPGHGAASNSEADAPPGPLPPVSPLLAPARGGVGDVSSLARGFPMERAGRPRLGGPGGLSPLSPSPFFPFRGEKKRGLGGGDRLETPPPPTKARHWGPATPPGSSSTTRCSGAAGVLGCGGAKDPPEVSQAIPGGWGWAIPGPPSTAG